MLQQLNVYRNLKIGFYFNMVYLFGYLIQVQIPNVNHVYLSLLLNVVLVFLFGKIQSMDLVISNKHVAQHVTFRLSDQTTLAVLRFHDLSASKEFLFLL